MVVYRSNRGNVTGVAMEPEPFTPLLDLSGTFAAWMLQQSDLAVLVDLSGMDAPAVAGKGASHLQSLYCKWPAIGIRDYLNTNGLRFVSMIT